MGKTWPVHALWPLHRYRAGEVRQTSRLVAEETPLHLVYNGVLPYAVMMGSPTDLEDFALGFSLAEQIIEKPDSCQAIEISQQDDAVILHIQIASAAFRTLLHKKKRGITGSTACGICGSGTSGAGFRPVRTMPVRKAFSLKAIRRALAQMRCYQKMNAPVKMLHAAFWVSLDGAVLLVREDIGRHNALDKLIGAMHHQAVSPEEGICLLTSRCSFDMVQKAVLAGIRCLVAVSAPTARALRLARDTGLALVAPAHDDEQNIFCGVEAFCDLETQLIKTGEKNDMLFEFERDFAGSLRCIPMIVRQKLDLVKIKMTLRQWSRLPQEERHALVVMSCDSEEEKRAFHTAISALIAQYADEPLRSLTDVDYDAWQRSDVQPEDIQRQAERDGISAPNAKEWAAFTPLQRFALVKLAGSKHENMNFLPALKEFGYL